jgi:1,4-dihydroxy-2-naphthoate octaprenyltransferase
MIHIKDAIKLYITVSRWEFLPAVSIGILIGIFLGAESIQYLYSGRFVITLIEGIIIFLLLFNVGFMVNCWADWKVDELYKTKLYKAVNNLGRSNLGILVVIHIILCIILAAHLTMVIGRFEINLLVWIGTFLGVAYSVEPFRFKRRGILHSLIALPIFFIPGVYSYFLVSKLSLNAPFTYFFLFAAVGITFAHYGLILVSQAEDLPADKKMELYTPAVIWGLKKTLLISVILNIIGSFIIIISLMLMFLTVNIWLNILLPLVVIGRYLSIIGVYNLYKKSLDISSNILLLTEIRVKMSKYPMWHAYGLSGITISSLLILVFRTLGWISPFQFL